MSRTENEQEFVLGNKQLLSAFFVVVALLGVFFVMGYIVGKNTNAPDSSGKKGAVTEPAPVTTATESVPSRAPDAVPAPVPVPETPADIPAEKPTAVKKEVPTPKPVIEADPKPPVAQVKSESGHTYLQVAALKRPNADAMVKVLKERDYPALLGESSKPGYFRVLVGPYSDPEKLAQAKTDIKKMGFEPAVVR